MIDLNVVLAHVSPHGNVQPHLYLRRMHVMKLWQCTCENELGIIPVGIP